jgi:MinD-like ATPase involved in chromosome partitioning or flagellar assembly
MKHIIIADSRKPFLEDISTRVLLDERNITIDIAINIKKAINLFELKPDSILAVSENLASDENINLITGLPRGTVYGFGVATGGEAIFGGLGIPCIGRVVMTGDMLDLLEEEPIKATIPATTPNATTQQIPAAQPQQQPQQQPQAAPVQQVPVQNYVPPAPVYAQPIQNQPIQNPQIQNQPQQPIYNQQSMPIQQTQQPIQQPQQPLAPVQAIPEQYIQPASPQMQQGYQGSEYPQQYADNQQVIQPQINQSPTQQYAQAYPPPQQTYRQPEQYVQPNQQPTPSYQETYPQNAYQQPVYQNSAPTVPYTPQYQEQQTGAESVRSIHQQKLDEAADAELARDGINSTSQNKTKVISVYAAKGGVGKTTIASQTAVCLALTSNGRRNFKVCLVDYNIDFGDVMTTLALNPKGVCITHWCADIKERIERGHDPNTITYDVKDIENTWLQRMSKTGLYVLTAPVVHEDSMDINDVELSVILRNLIENGGFDYIICDTGNNTRDSSVIALEMADYVLMVATQDVTTVNCNDSFLNTIKKIGFDTSKMRLVVNSVMPSQSTGITVKEIEESIPYPCIARIKRSEDVIKANNLGVPLVYNPKHDFTKQIQNIVHYITGKGITGLEDPEPKKRKFLFFGKHGN